jgi:hypothetical protein
LQSRWAGTGCSARSAKRYLAKGRIRPPAELRLAAPARAVRGYLCRGTRLTCRAPVGRRKHPGTVSHDREHSCDTFDDGGRNTVVGRGRLGGVGALAKAAMMRSSGGLGRGRDHDRVLDVSRYSDDVPVPSSARGCGAEQLRSPWALTRGQIGIRCASAPVTNVRYCPRLCENSDARLACRTSFSISSMWESVALATTVRRRKLRKQFCAFSAVARFHTAWSVSVKKYWSAEIVRQKRSLASALDLSF